MHPTGDGHDGSKLVPVDSASLRHGSALDAALSADGLHALEALLDDGIRSGAFPGAVALIARGGIVGWHVARGNAQVIPSSRPATVDTIYDLASLTKVLAALPAVLSPLERGALRLEDPVQHVLPEFAGDGREQITIRHLLAHTSGLPSWKALYLTASSRAAMLAAICRTPLAAAPGAVVDYSDLGILLLGAALERISGRRIDDLVAEAVTGPLGLEETMYTPPSRLWARCAATEVGNVYERDKVGDEGRAFRWREHVLVGEVHDGNTYYGMQGVAPHAGLFSTAWEVAAIASQWLHPGLLWTAATAAEATTDQTAGATGYPRGLGWILHHEGAFFESFGPRSFGHTGFTGTSLALDPGRDLLVVLLTNRVHLGGANMAIQQFRLRFHDAVSQAAP